MALSFNGVSQYLTQSAIATGVPLSFACWYNPSNILGVSGLLGIANTSAQTTIAMDLQPTKLRAISTLSNVVAFSDSVASLTTGTWFHCVTVFASNTSRINYLNGFASTVNTTSIIPTGLNITVLGALFYPGATSFAFGSIAYPSVWNIALTPTDVANLYNSGQGVNPNNVETSNLISFSALKSGPPYLDSITTANWTLTGSPILVSDPFAMVSTSAFPVSIDTFKAIPNPTVTPTNLVDSSDDTLSTRLQQHSDAIVKVQTYLLNTFNSVNVTSFGADAKGVTDSSAAITSAIASVNTGTGGNVFFPSGTYKILSAISVVLGSGVSISFQGAGQDNTVLFWPNSTNGFNITYGTQGFPVPESGSTFQNMALVSGSPSVGIALNFSDPSYATGAATLSSNVYDCTFRGSTLGNGWSTGIQFDRVPITNVYNCLMYGANNIGPWSMIGIFYVGSSTAINTQFTIFGLTTFFTNRSIYCSDYVQGLMMTGCSFTACTDGVYVNCPSQLQFQFSLFNSQINCTDACIRLNNVTQCNIVGNLLTSAFGGVVNTFGIVMSNCSGITIIGNSFLSSGGFSGIYQCITVNISNASAYPITIDGNSFGSPMTYGVVIDGTSQGVTVGRSNGFGTGIYRVLNGNAGNNLVSGPHVSNYTTLSGTVIYPIEGAGTTFSSSTITGNATIRFDGIQAGSYVYSRVINTSGSPHTLNMSSSNPTLGSIVSKVIGVGEIDMIAVGISIPNGGQFHFQGMSDGGSLLLTCSS